MRSTLQLVDQPRRLERREFGIMLRLRRGLRHATNRRGGRRGGLWGRLSRRRGVSRRAFGIRGLSGRCGAIPPRLEGVFLRRRSERLDLFAVAGAGEGVGGGSGRRDLRLNSRKLWCGMPF
jgi:hypothetical protein